MVLRLTTHYPARRDAASLLCLGSVGGNDKSPLSQGDVTITRLGIPELWGRDHQSHKGQCLSLTHCSSQSPSARFYRLKFSDERAEPGTSRTGVAPTEGELAEHGDQRAGDTGPPWAPHQRGKAHACGPPEGVTFGGVFPCVSQALALLCLYVAAH